MNLVAEDADYDSETNGHALKIGDRSIHFQNDNTAPYQTKNID